jgi:uncharacterized membrane protein YjfL (UPF0719 family)
MDALTNTLEFIVEKLPFFGAGLVLLFLGKLFYNATTRYDIDHEVADDQNAAVGISFAGFLIGLAFVVASTVVGAGGDLGTELISIGISGALAIVLLRASMIINDKLILHSFLVRKELQEKNVGTGYVVAGSSIATGLILAGVMSGQSDGYGGLIVDVLIYWAVGQAILVVDGLIFQAITRYDVHKLIEDDHNPAVGISFGAFLVAQGLIVKTALTGAGSDLGRELLITVLIAVIGLILLVVGRVIADRVFIPKASLAKEVADKKNVAAAAVAAGTLLALALLFSAAADPAAATALSVVEGL